MIVPLSFAILAAAQVEWVPSYDEARATAQTTGKPILVYVFDSR